MLPKKSKKVSRLSLFRIKNRRTTIKNKFYSKAQCFKVDFTGNKFLNVNLKGAILTSCNFKSAMFVNVDFLGTNLKKTNMKNARFEKCIFSGALLNKTNFQGATFKDCFFINTNFERAKNFFADEEKNIFLKHQDLIFDAELVSALDNFRYDEKIHNSRIIHQRGGKINTVTVSILLRTYGMSSLIKALQGMVGNLPSRVITIESFKGMIDNELLKLYDAIVPPHSIERLSS